MAGGFDAEPVLGSVSTHLRSGLGGFSGTRLRPGDRLPLKLAEAPQELPQIVSPPAAANAAAAA